MKAANELPHLRELQVYHTRVTDAGIKALRNNDQLRKLTIGPQFSRRITEASLADIATLNKLEELEFGEAILTWEGGLKELVALKDHLKKLKLEHALIAPADYERLQVALPNTQIQYRPATAEQAKQMQAAMAQTRR